MIVVGRDFVLRVAVGACAVVVLLSSCSSGGAEAPRVSGTSASAVSPGASVLERLTEDSMCALLADASVERAFAAEVEGRKGMKRGRMPMSLSFECDYGMKGALAVSTDLATTDAGKSDQELLDGVFTDRTNDSKKVGDHQRVEGLGTLADFGADPVLGAAGLAASNLGVVATVDGERLVLTVSVTGKAELSQVRPLAEELLTNLKSAVG